MVTMRKPKKQKKQTRKNIRKKKYNLRGGVDFFKRKTATCEESKKKIEKNIKKINEEIEKLNKKTNCHFSLYTLQENIYDSLRNTGSQPVYEVPQPLLPAASTVIDEKTENGKKQYKLTGKGQNPEKWIEKNTKNAEAIETWQRKMDLANTIPNESIDTSDELLNLLVKKNIITQTEFEGTKKREWFKHLKNQKVPHIYVELLPGTARRSYAFPTPSPTPSPTGSENIDNELFEPAVPSTRRRKSRRGAMVSERVENIEGRSNRTVTVKPAARKNTLWDES
jgi:hypothetical protein